MDVYAKPGTKARAVMVWVHGGCFVNGGGDEYDGSYLADDVVVVIP
jgi:carboxylesterase type B